MLSENVFTEAREIKTRYPERRIRIKMQFLPNSKTPFYGFDFSEQGIVGDAGCHDDGTKYVIVAVL